MACQADSSQFPVFLVVGRTRIGKGEFISTAHRTLEGEALPDIVSRSLVSHTTETNGYPMRLGDRDVRMVDTVGFDDSGGADIPEESLLHFLGETGKANFYPPLVIIQTLSALEKNLLMKMVAVFSEIVVAVRMDDVSAIGERAHEIRKQCGIEPIETFRLQTFLQIAPESRQLYDNDVSEILDFYEALTPSRKKLDFSSPLFDGFEVRRPSSPEKITEKDEKKTRVTRRKTRSIIFITKKAVVDNSTLVQGMAAASVACNVGAVGYAAGATAYTAGATAAISEIPAILSFAAPAAPAVSLGPVGFLLALGIGLGGAVLALSQPKKEAKDTKESKDTKDAKDIEEEEIVYVAKNEEIDVEYIVTREIRKTYKRKVHEVWKVLAGKIEIFIRREYSPWEKSCDELLRCFEAEVPADPSEGEDPEGPSKEERVD